MYSNDLMLCRVVLKSAYRAADNGEIPVGAIVVDNDKKTIVSKGWNQVNLLHDPTAHAEMLAITSATSATQTRHLPSYTVMVSLEPCIMRWGNPLGAGKAGSVSFARRQVWGNKSPWDKTV